MWIWQLFSWCGFLSTTKLLCWCCCCRWCCYGYQIQACYQGNDWPLHWVPYLFLQNWFRRCSFASWPASKTTGSDPYHKLQYSAHFFSHWRVWLKIFCSSRFHAGEKKLCVSKAPKQLFDHLFSTKTWKITSYHGLWIMRHLRWNGKPEIDFFIDEKFANFKINIECRNEKATSSHLERTHAYFYQIQATMYSTGRQWCDFVVRTTASLHGTCWTSVFWLRILEECNATPSSILFHCNPSWTSKFTTEG